MMKRKLTEMITRSLAFVLSLGITSGAWAGWIGDAGTTAYSTSDSLSEDVWIGDTDASFKGDADSNWLVWESSDGSLNYGLSANQLRIADWNASEEWPLYGRLKINSGTYRATTGALMVGAATKYCTAYLTVNGGYVESTGDFDVGIGGSTAVFEMNGGTVLTKVNAWWGADFSKTTATINDGTLTINGNFNLLNQNNDGESGSYCKIYVNGGSVSSAETWFLGRTGDAYVELNGGRFVTSRVGVNSTANAKLKLNGGTLVAPAVDSGLNMTVGAKGGTIENASAGTIAATVTGVGTITKKGTGTLTFSGDMSGFIGKVAVASGAGSVTLPATAKRARAGDYTAVVTNQDGTFTFSYDANAGDAATATATLLSLDFEDDSYAEDASGWVGKTIEGQIINSPKNDVAGATRSQGTRATGSKYLHLALNKNASRGVVYVLPTSCTTASEYSLEFDWFSAAGVIYNNAGNSSGFALYDTAGKEIVGVEVPCAGNNNLFDSTVYAGAKEIELGSIKAKRMADPTTETELWHHILITGNASDSSMKLTITDGNGTKKISNVSLGGFVNVAQIYVCLGTKASYESVRGGIDNVVFSIPAVAAVDNTPYATFASAVAAATSSSTITLYSDVELTSSVELPYGATLDLNGYALYTTDSSVDVLFDDGLHCLSSTTAGGFTTFATSVVYMDMVNVWTGKANDNTWATPGNWSKGAAPSSATDVVYIPAGDAISIACADSGDYTGVLTIDRNVTLTGIEKRIKLSTVKGLGTLTLDSTSSSKYFYLTPVDGGDFSIYCDLVISNPVYNEKYDNTYGRKLKVYGKVSGNGNIQHDNKNGTGFAFYDDLSSYSGNYVGGRGGNYTRDETAFDDDARGSALAKWTFGRYADSNKNTYRDPFKVSNVTYEFGQLTSGAGLSMLHATGATIEVGALADETSNVSMTLSSSSNTFRKKGATSTANLTLTESVGAVEAEAGTLNLKGTVVPESLTITGAGATVTVEAGNSAVPVLADSLKDGYTVVATAGDGLTTYKAGANCTITWKVDGLGDEVVSSYVGAVVSHADAVRNGYVFDRWDPAVVSPATGDATYTAIWKTAVVSVSKPVVAYGADYTRATVTAAVNVTTPGDVTYELTVTKGSTTKTYTGTVSGGTVTFADVAVPREAADIYADITYTVTPKAGTAALASAATTEAPTTKSECGRTDGCRE